MWPAKLLANARQFRDQHRLIDFLCVSFSLERERELSTVICYVSTIRSRNTCSWAVTPITNSHISFWLHQWSQPCSYHVPFSIESQTSLFSIQISQTSANPAKPLIVWTIPKWWVCACHNIKGVTHQQTTDDQWLEMQDNTILTAYYLHWFLPLRNLHEVIKIYCAHYQSGRNRGPSHENCLTLKWFETRRTSNGWGNLGEIWKGQTGEARGGF